MQNTKQQRSNPMNKQQLQQDIDDIKTMSYSIGVKYENTKIHTYVYTSFYTFCIL